MKKASIKKIFKRGDKSPKTPKEEVWGELCTTRTLPKQLSPGQLFSSNKNCPQSPKQSSPTQQRTPKQLSPGNSSQHSSGKLGGSSASSCGSRGSIEYSIERRVSNGSSVEGMSRFSSRSISSTLKSTSSTRRNVLSPPNHSGLDRRRSYASPRPSPNIGGRGTLQRYKSASAVDVDAPIEAYEGPVDLDESIHSGSSGTISVHGEDAKEIDKDCSDRVIDTVKLSPTTVDVDAPMDTDEVIGRDASSPDTIPVIYEDCYDSDTCNGISHSTVKPHDVNQDISREASTIPPELGIPLTSEFTNDENIDLQRDDDDESAVYSLTVLNEDESIMEPLSTDEMEDERMKFNSLPQRLETDDSALDDEDYYRQDYFSMMTRSARIAYEDRQESGGDNAEEERFSSFPERVLMTDDSSGVAKRLSSQELVGMTEPDLPLDIAKDDEDEGGDYGDLYTDASFPLQEDVEQDIQEAMVEAPTHAFNVEEDQLSAFSERVLLSKEAGEIVKPLSSQELIRLTEPALPEGAKLEDDDSVDYGDLHNNASFPMTEDEHDGTKDNGHDEANSATVNGELVSGEPLSSFLKEWLTSGEIEKQMSSEELIEMPEPNLSNEDILASEQNNEGMSSDDINSNALFPFAVDGAEALDAKDIDIATAAFVDEESWDDENISKAESYTDETSSIRQNRTEPISESQDTIPCPSPIPTLPEDNKFVYERNDADNYSGPRPDDMSIQKEESSEVGEEELIDIGNVIVEESNIAGQEPSHLNQSESEIDEVHIGEQDNANYPLEYTVKADQGDDRGDDLVKETDVCDNHDHVEEDDTDQTVLKDGGVMMRASDEHDEEDDQPNLGTENTAMVNSPDDGTDKDVAKLPPTSQLLRSHSFVDSPSQSESTAEASPRRHSLFSLSMENGECGNSIQHSKTPHKEITDNLVVAGVMSLFMGGGRFRGRNQAKAPVKDNIANALSTQNDKSDEKKLSAHEESPSMCSMPSLASPLPTPLITTTSSSATFSKAYSPLVQSMQIQLDCKPDCTEGQHDEFDDETPRSLPGTEKLIGIIGCDVVSTVLRGRSLSPSPKRRQIEIERSTSLPDKWAPFPVSSPRASLLALSKQLKSPSQTPPEDRATGSDAINSDEAPSDGTDFPQLPLISINGSCTPEGRLSPAHSKASVELSPPREHMVRHQETDGIDVKKLMHDNHRLRVKRKQLCESLGSIARQFAAHEDASTEKIHTLEQKIRALVAEKESTALSCGNYDAETVRRLSTGVLVQDKLLEAKDKQISQLTLRLEVLRRNLHDKEESLASARKLWEEERIKMHNILTSPERQSHYTLKQELFESRMEVSRLKDALDNALSDIDALTLALESNNEALDRSIQELEQLRKWKTEHSNEVNVCTPTIPRTIVPTLSTSPSRGTKKRADVMRIQHDLANELKEIRDLVITSDRKEYHELEEEIRLLEDEVKASLVETKLANERIEQLSLDVKAKTAELMRLQQERSMSSTLSSTDSHEKMNIAESKEEAPVEKMAASPSYSDLQSKDLLKDFSIVSDLESKIAQLEEKLAEYEKPAETYAEEIKGTNAEEIKETNTLDIASSNEPLPDSETSKSISSQSKKQHPPESPLTARNLFQPLRRGWATASPLIRNIATSPESRDSSVQDKDAEIVKLNKTIKANTEVMEKLKRDIIKIQSEKEETEFDMTTKINQLKEENLAYASQVDVLEKAFMEMNDQRASDGDDATDDGSAEAILSPQSEKSNAAQEENDGYESKTLSLQRSIVELESTQSHQEDEIEHLKAELVKLRVTSQQEKDAALEQLREEVAIVTAQRSALESQLVEINKSAGLLRDSLPGQASSPKKEPESTLEDPKSPNSHADDGVAGGDPILVAQVVMLENANRVLESSVNSLRFDMQQKLAPLLEKIAMLEEEKRIMEDEMTAKLQCREMTITNLENSLQQLTSTRMLSKKKKHSKINSPPQTPSS